MNTRTKWLLAGVAILAILYTGDYLYRSLIEEPSRKATAALDRLDNQLQQAADSQLVAKKISQKMESYSGRSLPYEAEVARSLYQDWLLKLMERHKMTGISIDASAPVPIEIKSRTNKKKTRLVGYRITYTVHGKTALPQWVQWVREFEQAGHLHKLQNFTLVPLGNGSELDANMTIEAVSLQSTERPDTLSSWVRDPQQESSSSSLASLVQRNIFARGFSKTLAAIRLQAITYNRRGEGEAWFDLGESTPTQILTLGQSLQLPVHEVMLLGVQGDLARLKVNGTEIEVTIGKAIGDVMQPLDGQSEEPTPSSPAAAEVTATTAGEAKTVLTSGEKP